MRKLFVAVPIALLAVGGSTACASKKFVRTSVGEVNDKVDSLGKSLEETQERTRQNEGKIANVDQKADRAQQAAQQAHNAANEARSAASPRDRSSTSCGINIYWLLKRAATRAGTRSSFAHVTET